MRLEAAIGTRGFEFERAPILDTRLFSRGDRWRKRPFQATRIRQMESAASEVRLPPVKTRGYRHLDDLLFECEVIGLDVAQKTLVVRYLDDQQVEHGVSIDEFQVIASTTNQEANNQQQQEQPSGIVWMFFSNDQNDATPLWMHVFSFLDHLEWIQSLLRVCKPWARHILNPIAWRVCRLPHKLSDGHYFQRVRRLLHVDLHRMALICGHEHDQSTSGPYAKDSVTQLLIHRVTQRAGISGHDAVKLISLCPLLQRIELHRCDFVSILFFDQLERTRRQDDSMLLRCDVWLCRHLSPFFVRQIAHQFQHALQVEQDTTGFYMWTISSNDWNEIREALAKHAVLPNESSKLLSKVLLMPKEWLLRCIDAQDSPFTGREWMQYRVPLERFPRTIVPIMEMDDMLCENARTCDQEMVIGFPASVEDLKCLALEVDGIQCAQSIEEKLRQAVEIAGQDRLQEQKRRDSLKERADVVFAQLHETTKALERQVAALETQVESMARIKDQAQQEYLEAQRQLDRVAKEADRALFSLASTQANHPPAAPVNGVPTILPGDDQLPALPTKGCLASMGKALERDAFAILDGFVGEALSLQARHDVEQLYQDSNRFQAGELAGGKTGRSLRYQMQHVRGDAVLWIDEHDEHCPRSIQRILRQMDRILLERLGHYNAEVEASALLRKKAMITCYPGNGAHYTRHCDNPNKNGRKLTAILYLNPSWESHHGGELQITTNSKNETTIAPVLDRLLLFYSDRRMPHQVLPAYVHRFALTVWYLDYDEYMNAQVFGDLLQDSTVENARIQQEMHLFAMKAA